nr:MAG TPA: hypothetical protein [Caudoviricetes sp.]
MLFYVTKITYFVRNDENILLKFVIHLICF